MHLRGGLLRKRLLLLIILIIIVSAKLDYKFKYFDKQMLNIYVYTTLGK
jgi:hypothetical protein